MTEKVQKEQADQGNQSGLKEGVKKKVIATIEESALFNFGAITRTLVSILSKSTS